MSSRFKDLRVKSKAEFDWFIEHLTNEAYRARNSWDFLGAFELACDEYSTELNQTPDFWGLTRRAHKDVLVLRLGRLYDPHAAAATLGNLFQTMKDHKASPGACFPAELKSLDPTELETDISIVSDENPAVAKLLVVRNEYLAHRGKKHVQKGNFDLLPTLDPKEIDSLIVTAVQLMSKYRDRLGYGPIGWGHHEMEQFRRLLSLLRAGLRRDSA